MAPTILEPSMFSVWRSATEKEAQEIISKIKARFQSDDNLRLGLQPWRYAFPCMLLERPCQFRIWFYQARCQFWNISAGRFVWV